jgi:hypothetical protein
MRKFQQYVDVEGNYFGCPKHCIWCYSFSFGISGDAMGCPIKNETHHQEKEIEINK